MITYEDAIKDLNNSTFRIEKHEKIRKKFLQLTRLSTLIFILLVSIYSLYLVKVKGFSFFNYGLAWWIAIFLLVLGWVGELVLVLRGTRMYKEYLVKIQHVSDVIYETYGETNLHEIPPFLSTPEQTRNPEFLHLFEYLFWDFAKEIQEDYLNRISIYCFDIDTIHGLSDFLDTKDISQRIGVKVAQKYDTVYYDSIHLGQDEDYFLQDCIVIYTTEK